LCIRLAHFGPRQRKIAAFRCRLAAVRLADRKGETRPWETALCRWTTTREVEAPGFSNRLGTKYVHNAATALNGHGPHCVLDAEQRAEHVGVEGLGVAGWGDVGDRGGMSLCAGGIDHHIDSTESGDGGLDERLYLFFEADVGLDKLDVRSSARSSAATSAPAAG
jgi:hypothetical protein